mgnify:CR=1 FL=1
MSMDGCSLHIFRACNVNAHQLVQLLQPFGGRLPMNEVQLRELTTALRRVGHIVEHTPNNIAQSLHSNRHSRPGQYYNNAANEVIGFESFFSQDVDKNKLIEVMTTLS